MTVVLIFQPHSHGYMTYYFDSRHAIAENAIREAKENAPGVVRDNFIRAEIKEKLYA